MGKKLITFAFSLFECLATTELKFYKRQCRATQDSTSSTTGFRRITVLPFHYNQVLEASKVGRTDSSETILEGTATK